MLLPSALGFFLIHLCRFTVRYSTNNSGFSRPFGSHISYFSSVCVIDLLGCTAVFQPYLLCLPLIPFQVVLPSASPQFCHTVVQESQPVVHRLTPLGLALGSRLPRADQLYPGNLDTGRKDFHLTCHSFRHSLLKSPQLLYGTASFL